MKVVILSPVFYKKRRYSIGETLDLDDKTAGGLLELPHQPVRVIGPSPLPSPDNSDQIFDSTLQNPEISIDDIAEDPAPPEPPSDNPEPTEPIEPIEPAEDGVLRASVNGSTVDELTAAFQQVNGIGSGSAKAIVENRPYESVEEVPEKADLVGTAAKKWPEVSKFLTL